MTFSKGALALAVNRNRSPANTKCAGHSIGETTSGSLKAFLKRQEIAAGTEGMNTRIRPIAVRIALTTPISSSQPLFEEGRYDLNPQNEPSFFVKESRIGKLFFCLMTATE